MDHLHWIQQRQGKTFCRSRHVYLQKLIQSRLQRVKSRARTTPVLARFEPKVPPALSLESAVVKALPTIYQLISRIYEQSVHHSLTLAPLTRASM